MKNESSPEAQEALKTLETADKLNSAFIKEGAAGVRTLANRLATQQFPTKGFEDFYRELSNTVGLEPQVRAIILSMADEMRRSQEYTLNRMRESQVGREIREALRKSRPSPMAEGGTLTELSRPSIDGILDEEWNTEDGERSIF